VIGLRDGASLYGHRGTRGSIVITRLSRLIVRGLLVVRGRLLVIRLPVIPLIIEARITIIRATIISRIVAKRIYWAFLATGSQQK
jgi:hypothetical protein